MSLRKAISRRLAPWSTPIGHLDIAGDAPLRRDGPFAVAITEEATIVGSGPTEVMRTSEYPFWVMFRDHLRNQGIDPSTAVLAESYEEGPTAGPMADVREVGVLISGDERVLEYEYAYETEAWVTWEEITANWRGSKHRTAIEAALERTKS